MSIIDNYKVTRLYIIQIEYICIIIYDKCELVESFAIGNFFYSFELSFPVRNFLAFCIYLYLYIIVSMFVSMFACI